MSTVYQSCSNSLRSFAVSISNWSYSSIVSGSHHRYADQSLFFWKFCAPRDRFLARSRAISYHSRSICIIRACAISCVSSAGNQYVSYNSNTNVHSSSVLVWSFWFSISFHIDIVLTKRWISFRIIDVFFDEVSNAIMSLANISSSRSHNNQRW